MAEADFTASALAQGFYLSKQFQSLRVETRDYREHPVLGGISSTRWNAYSLFSSENSKLVDTLTRLQIAPAAIQLRNKSGAEQWTNPFLESIGIDSLVASNHSLRTSGFLSGNKARNRLTGSPEGDVLMGWGGRDTLIGSGSDDVLCGGADADRFLYKGVDTGAELERDEIVDFNGEGGDRIAFSGRGGLIVNEFSGKKGEATFAVWMARLAPSRGETIYPWMYCGTVIHVDRNGDKIADLAIDLPGVFSFQKDWITFAY